MENNLNEFRRSQVEEPVVNTASEEVIKEDEVKPNEQVTSPEAVEPDDNAESGFSLLTVEEAVEPENVADPVEVSQKSNVKVSVEDYLINNKDILKNYFKYKDLDLESLTDEQIVIEGLRRKNPRWSETDLKDELEIKYGIGLTKKVVTDDMDSDEIDEVERYNKKIDEKVRNGNRYLRADVEGFKKDLEDFKGSLVIPELETEVEFKTNQQEYKTVEQVQAEVQEWREKEWIPVITDTVSKVKGVKTIVKVNVDEGVTQDLELSYTLTDTQKEALNEYMNNYVDQPSDSKFVKEDGSVDYQGLVQEKATWLFSSSIITTMVKEGIAKVKGDFIKNRLVNYEDTGNLTTKPNISAENSIEERFKQRGLQRQANNSAFKF